MKAVSLRMGCVAKQATELLKLELTQLKSFVLSIKTGIECEYESLTSSWENLAMEMDNKEREIKQRMIIDHELELNDFKKLNEAKSEEIDRLKLSLTELTDCQEKEKHDFEKRLDDIKLDKDHAVREVTEQLSRQHKAEIENMRSRFRLMAVGKMERSPSDPNLEKIERTDNKELINHETIIQHIKENCEIDKGKAINAAIVKESRKWETMLNEKIAEIKEKCEIDKELLLDECKRISEDKDKQIDLLRERETNLQLECIKYKNTIQQLAESDDNSQVMELMKKIEVLEKERSTLESQLTLEKSRRVEDSIHDMGASVAVCEGDSIKNLK